jgi:hypothetical protein
MEAAIAQKVVAKFDASPQHAKIRVDNIYRCALGLNCCAFTTVDAYVASKLLKSCPMHSRAARHLGEHLALFGAAYGSLPLSVRAALEALEKILILAVRPDSQRPPSLDVLVNYDKEAKAYLVIMLKYVEATLVHLDPASPTFDPAISPLDIMPGYNEDYHFVEHYIDRVFHAVVKQLLDLQLVDLDPFIRRVSKLSQS